MLATEKGSHKRLDSATVIACGDLGLVHSMPGGLSVPLQMNSLMWISSFTQSAMKAPSSFRNGNLCWGPEGIEGTEYDPLYSEYVQGALVASHTQTS